MKEMIIKYCGCKTDKHNNPQGASYQNNKLKTGNRYHTQGSLKNNKVSITCTVCGKVT